MEEELNKENIEEQKIKKFIGNNADIIYKKMNKKFSFNIYCMLFTFFYLLYRKMYLIAIVSFIIQSIIANYVKNIMVSLICFIVWGFAFYPLYKIHIHRKIEKLNTETMTEEEFKKKGGTSIVSIIIVPLVLFIILILSMGMRIFDSASESLNNNIISVPTLINQNEYNYYSYNGAVIKYNNEWKEQEVPLPEGGTQKGIINNKSGVLVTVAEVESIENENLDYSNRENREKIYNLLESTFKYQASASGFKVNWQDTEYLLKNDKYYVLFDISKNEISMREYIILNIKDSKVCAIVTGAKSKEILDNNQAQVLEILQTLEF